MRHSEGINITRGEFDALREEVREVRGLLERTRVVLHGEDGTNGLRSSLERAHKAIKDVQTSVKLMSDAVAELSLTSATGDKDMQVLVIEELRRLERDMQTRSDRERRWRIGQTITLVFGVVGILLTVTL